MIGHVEDLKEILETLGTCHKRPQKYMAKALKPILEFSRYKVYDKCAMREFYSLLGAKVVGHIGLLKNDQTIPKIT